MSVGLVERILCRALPHFDIVKEGERFGPGHESTLYLRRFFLLRWPGGGGLFLHAIHRSDDDPDPHDHPWDFVTLILRGGYYDEAYDRASRLGAGAIWWAEHEWVGPGAVRFRRAEHLHRVVLRGGTPLGADDRGGEIAAWSLVLTGRRRRQWGFARHGAWVPWWQYLGLSCDPQADASDGQP